MGLSNPSRGAATLPIGRCSHQFLRKTSPPTHPRGGASNRWTLNRELTEVRVATRCSAARPRLIASAVPDSTRLRRMRPCGKPPAHEPLGIDIPHVVHERWRSLRAWSRPVQSQPDWRTPPTTPNEPDTTSELLDFTGQVALITGGSRGLGRQMALALAARGADVVVTSRKVDACVAVAAEIEAMGRQALPYGCHVADWDQIDQLVDAAYERFGKVDIDSFVRLLARTDRSSQSASSPAVPHRHRRPLGHGRLREARPFRVCAEARRRTGRDRGRYLASSTSSFTTGTLMRVDGGER